MGVTSIQWTSTVRPDGTISPGYTFNPWRGCTKVHAGCTNCYAEKLSGRNPSTLGVWGPNGTRVVASESYWREPIKWNRAAEKAGERRRVFCASLADVFEDWKGPLQNHYGQTIGKCRHCGRFGGVVHRSEWERGEPEYFCRLSEEYGVKGCGEEQRLLPATLNDVRWRLFALIDATPNLDWLLLTKRPENVRRMWPAGEQSLHQRNYEDGRSLSHRENVWIGTSVSDQPTYDAYWPLLAECHDLASVLFLSAEPLLGPLQVTTHKDQLPDWIIGGGESGPKARPCNVAWIRSIVEQCKAASVPCFVKQLGSNPEELVEPCAKARANGWDVKDRTLYLKDSKGGDPSEWPEDLRVRQLPEAAK